MSTFYSGFNEDIKIKVYDEKRHIQKKKKKKLDEECYHQITRGNKQEASFGKV